MRTRLDASRDAGALLARLAVDAAPEDVERLAKTVEHGTIGIADDVGHARAVAAELRRRALRMRNT